MRLHSASVLIGACTSQSSPAPPGQGAPGVGPALACARGGGGGGTKRTGKGLAKRGQHALRVALVLRVADHDGDQASRPQHRGRLARQLHEVLHLLLRRQPAAAQDEVAPALHNRGRALRLGQGCDFMAQGWPQDALARGGRWSRGDALSKASPAGGEDGDAQGEHRKRRRPLGAVMHPRSTGRHCALRRCRPGPPRPRKTPGHPPPCLPPRP